MLCTNLLSVKQHELKITSTMVEPIKEGS